MIVVHVTDLHAHKNIEYLYDKAKSASEIINKCLDNSDSFVLVFSGDITHSGNKEEYESAAKLISEMVRRLTIKPKMCLCPGNHDRLFDEGEVINKKYLCETNSDNFSERYVSNKRRNKQFKAFKERYNRPRHINDIMDCYDIHVNGNHYSFYCLNNSLLSTYEPDAKEKHDYNYSNIFLREDCLDLRRKGEDELVFLVMHMPIDYLSASTKTRLESLCKEYVDFILCGHTHENTTTIKTSSECGYIQLTGSALLSNGMSRFNIYKIDDLTLEKRVYLFDKNERSYKEEVEPEIINYVKKHINEKNLSYDSSIFKNENVTIGSYSNIPIDDVFVFPTLITSSYNIHSKSYIYGTFDDFCGKVENNEVIQIKGDDSSGKTTLLEHLFKQYFEKDYFPIYCEGTLFYKTDLNKAINNAIKNNYDEATRKTFLSLDKSRKILLVDDFENVDVGLIKSLLGYFGTIIYTSNYDCVTRVEDEMIGIKYSALEIEPLYYSKREELANKIYHVLEKKRPELETIIDKDKYFVVLNRFLDKVNKYDIINPSSLIVVIGQLLSGIEDYDNESYRTFYRYKILVSIEKGLRDKNLINTDIHHAERMVSYVAYKAYNDRINSFGKSFFDEAANYEENEYGHRPFNKCDSFIDVLESSKVIKKLNDNEYMFHDKNVFAYFVGYYSISRFREDNDESCLREIISRGVYISLNFQILMSIVANFEENRLIRFFISDLEDKISDADAFEYKKLEDFIEKFDTKQNQFLASPQDKLEEMKTSKTKEEREQSKEIVKHSNDYFYEKDMTENLKKLVTWTNTMRILSVLFNSFISVIRAKDKDVLVKMIIKLPNVVIGCALNDFLDNVDKLLLELNEKIAKEGITQKILDSTKEVVTDLVRAVILTIYHNCYMMLSNNMANEVVSKNLIISGDKTKRIQELMLLSFSNKNDAFIKETTKSIKEGSDHFETVCARLIGRAYCMRNRKIIKTNRAFVDLITKGDIGDLLKDELKNIN